MATARGDQRKTRILDAVVKVIIDTGFTQMTVADVARRANVSTALVHYHFSSKTELIAAALRSACDDDKALRESVAAGPGSATSRLDRVVRGSLPLGATDGSWLLWVETWGEARREPSILQVMTDLNEHERDLIVSLLAEGTANAEFTVAEPVAVAERLMALRDGLAIQHTLFEAEQPAERFGALLRGAILNNLGMTVERYESLVAPDASVAGQEDR